MLSTASNMSPLVRASHARTLASRTLAPTGAVLLRGYQSQQVRSLWFNIFPSYLDQETSRDHKVRRNLLRSRYRYMKSLSRQLSWDNPGKAHNQAHENLDRYYMEFMAKRRGMRSPWHHMRCSGSRTASTESNPTSKDSSNPWMPELHSIRRYLDEQRDALASMIRPSDKNTTSSGFSASEPEYVIDPITNRKVPKHPSPVVDTTIDVGKAWEKRRSKLASLFDDLEKMDLNKESKEPRAFHSHGPPPPDELDKYREVTIDTPTYNEELIHRVEDLPKTKPQGVPPEPPQPASEAPEPPAEIKDELEQYKKVEINYPPSMNEELIHRVEDLPQKEEPVSVVSEAEKKKTSSIEMDGEPMYEDLDKYRPFMDRDEALDPNAEEVQTRSWPSRVRHLEQNIGTDSSSKVAESKVKPSSPPNGILNTQAAASWTPPSFRSLQSASLFGHKAPAETETAMFDYDPYSKEPTGLELSWDKECASDPKADKMYIRHYSSDGTASDPVVVAPSATPEALSEPEPVESLRAKSEASRDMHNSCQDMYGSAGYTLEKELRANQLAREEKTASQAPEDTAPLTSGESGEPTLYKILAYDPTMQKINVAETTLVVQDASTPLSPAEVMLRLSNPARFFPHFGPLQKEGFEIVSGSGDVLVFRKVRNTTEATTSGVNPIDMMGREAVPNLGNFASPTGFVNYDYPMEDEEVTASSSRPSAGEPKKGSTSQSTESSSTEQNTKPRKRGIVKRTATGAAWLAGTAYGVGVVSEFMKKGSETAKNNAKKV